LSIGSLFVMIQMTGEIKLHGLGSGVHESVHGWLAEVARLAPKERSGRSRDKLMAPAAPVLDEIVTVDDVAVAATAVVGQGP
jgi:mlo protein